MSQVANKQKLTRALKAHCLVAMILILLGLALKEISFILGVGVAFVAMVLSSMRLLVNPTTADPTLLLATFTRSLVMKWALLVALSAIIFFLMSSMQTTTAKAVYIIALAIQLFAGSALAALIAR